MRFLLTTAALILTLGGSAAFAIDPATTGTTPAPGASAPLKLEDLPAAVKKSYEEKADGVDPISIDKSTQGEKTVYTIKFMSKKDAKAHTLKIGEDGKIVGNGDDKKKGHKKDK